MNKKAQGWLILFSVVIGILLILFFIALTRSMYEQMKMQEKLDKCVRTNYDITTKEYDYNSIIGCCRKLNYYRDSYCLEKFKPGYRMEEKRIDDGKTNA